MIKGKTNSGFEFELSEETINNMELVDALAEASDDDPISVSRVVKLFLGDDLRKKLYDHLRNEQGRVPVAAVNTEVMEIFQAFGKNGKN